MQHDVIPELPEINPQDYPSEKISDVYQEIFQSPRKIIMYETKDGQFVTLFAGLDEVFYAGFLAALSKNTPRHIRFFNFLKLCMEGARLVKECTRKAFEAAARIEKSIKSGVLNT